jgi:hypothetical protein
MQRFEILLPIAWLFACGSDKGVTAFNSPPTASITSHSDGDEIREGYAVDLVAVLSDLNHQPSELTAAWTAGGREICPALPPDANGDSSCTAFVAQGEESITIEVRDRRETAARGEGAFYLLYVVHLYAPISSAASRAAG